MQNYKHRSGCERRESANRPSAGKSRAPTPSITHGRAYEKRHFGPLPAKGVQAIVTSGRQLASQDGGESSGVCLPVLYLVPLLGPGQGVLRAALAEGGPWIGDALSDAVHLIPVGDPRGGDEGFRRFVADVGLELAELERAWDDRLGARPSAGVLIAYEELLLSKWLRIERPLLPILLVFASGTPSPVHMWPVPCWAQESSRGASTLVTELGKRFSKQSTSPLLEDALASSAMAPRVIEGVAAVCLSMIEAPRGPSEVHLSPTDRRILRYIRALEEGTRVTTNGVANRLGLEAKSIGKNLAHLVDVGFLDNVRGEGYAVTLAGRLAAT